MSVESAKAFYSRMTTDEVFRTQLEQAASKEERKQILQAASYEFTPEEWQAATAQIQDLNFAESELSDAELEAVSGGGSVQAIYGSVWPSEVVCIDKLICSPNTPMYGIPAESLV
jgi:predicted ribosomally synthesized peptide with nif11-like leader